MLEVLCLKCEIPLEEILTSYPPEIILKFSVLNIMRYVLPLPLVICKESVCLESSVKSNVDTKISVPSDSTTICGDDKTFAALMIQSKSSADSSNEISGSGTANCFSGGTVIILGAQKRYLILLRPFIPEIRTLLS